LTRTISRCRLNAEKSRSDVSPLSSKHHHHIVVVMTVLKADEEDSEFEVPLIIAVVVTVTTMIISVSVTVAINVSENPHYESPAEIVPGCAYVRLTAETNGAMC
jgi:hypothetical protein